MTTRLCVAALASVIALGCGAPRPASPPNILWISVEDLSPRLPAYGDSLASTPNIDRLAAEGIRYTHAFTIAGVCAPSRASIITGMYPVSIGAQHMRTTDRGYLAVPPPDVRAFTEYLRAAGYYTANQVKTDYQFAPIQDPRQPLTAWDASGTTAHWRGRRPGQPFFAVFNSVRTHESKVWPNPDEEATVDPAAVSVPPYYPDTPVVRTDIARHYDNVTRVDAWVGQILNELREDGLEDSTVVFFWGDHGDGLPRAKRWVYDSGILVPLIVRWPDAGSGGTVEPRLVSFVDLAPTVLSIAGVAIPDFMQGASFLDGEPQRAYIYAARDRMDEVEDRIRAVRDSRFKYIRNYHPERPYVSQLEYRDRMPLMQELLRLHADDRLAGPQKLWFADTKPEEELYDVLADPHEIDNLASNVAFDSVLVRMRIALDEWQQRVGDDGQPESELMEDAWPGGVQPLTSMPAILPESGTYDEPVSIVLSSATPGASIAYTLEQGDDPHWLLYTGPFVLERSATVRAKAVRYGFAESEESTSVFDVR